MQARVLELAQEEAGDAPVTAELIRNAAKGLLNRCPVLNEEPSGDIAGDEVLDVDSVAGDGDAHVAGHGAGEDVDERAASRRYGFREFIEKFVDKKVPCYPSLALITDDDVAAVLHEIARKWERNGAHDTNDLEPLVRAWMERTNKSPAVAAIILEGVAAKLRAEEGQHE
jgi:hypothetical protein